MTLQLILAALGLLLLGSAAALATSRRDSTALALSTLSALAGCALGLGAAGAALWNGDTLLLEIDWPLPVGALTLGLDALSAFFLLCIFLVGGLAALYGWGYLRSGTAGAGRLGRAGALFNVLVAAMAAVALARDAVPFLAAWELMTFASFLLVTFEDERDEVRRAGMTYLIASQLGVVFVFALFGLLGERAGSFGFAAMASAGPPPAALAGLCFALALIGFGTKAGFWPVHIWLPDAHPAAPSHVSALMSGVMIKMGLYGLLRTLTLLGPAPAWWGGLLLAIGAVSAIVGVLLALAQKDLKRLLAYSSFENIGLIALGLGLGLLGRASGQPPMSFLGFAAALLHTLNHGLFKGLLFQAAGSILHATGTRQIERLGGLHRRMPWTSGAFLVGAVAISGLPPLNGFAGEFLLLLAAFRGGVATGTPASAAALALATIAVVALVSGLAAACFVRAYGIVFLGSPRGEEVAHAHEAAPSMRVAMVLGAGACVGIGLFPEGALRLLAAPAAQLSGIATAAAPDSGPLAALGRLGLVLFLVVGALALLRRRLLAGRDVREAPTWGCGYAAPTARMQYTGTSFSQPALAPFALLLPRHLELEKPSGFFPTGARCEERIGDLAGERLVVPVARRLVDVLGRVRVLQHGKLHLYLVYVLLSLLVLLTWELARQ